MKNKKIVVLGDSISEGLGKRKYNYIDYLKDLLGNKYSIYNCSMTGTTIYYTKKIYNKVIELNPNYAIVFYGSVDAQIRPNISGSKTLITKIIPKRYLKPHMVVPRPFYSHNFLKKIENKLDNKLRMITKFLVEKYEGTTQWINIEDFSENYEKLIINLLEHNITPILVSTMYLDNNFFNNSNVEYQKYNKVINRMSKKYKLEYVNVFEKFEQIIKDSNYNWDILYTKDHFHPNQNGYKLISELIYNKIKE